MIKGTNQEHITIANIHEQITGTPSFIKQTLVDIKTQTPPPNTIIVGDFNTLSHQ
jgi:hypothetical protein